MLCCLYFAICGHWMCFQNTYDQLKLSLKFSSVPAVIGSQAMWWRMGFFKCLLEPLSTCKHVCVCAWSNIRLQAGRRSSLSLFLALSLSLSLWRVSEGVCIRPLPWRYRPRMQPTQAPSGLYPAPPPRSGLQRWLSESLDQCHAASAGPPTHRPNTLKCCTYHGITQWPTCLFYCQNTEPRCLYSHTIYTIFHLTFL